MNQAKKLILLQSKINRLNTNRNTKKAAGLSIVSIDKEIKGLQAELAALKAEIMAEE